MTASCCDPRAIHWLVTATLLLFATLVSAEPFTGQVISVTDGDTITVLDRDSKPIRIRLNGIDCPEKGRGAAGQPYAERARLHRLELAQGRTVTVTWHKVDGYGRFVARVDVDGVDVGLEQLRAGLAWLFVRYIKEVPPADREAYAAAEQGARAAKRGLWQDSDPMPPWDWRKKKAEAGDEQ